jgi:RND family efflux transporter MFP subunit
VKELAPETIRQYVKLNGNVESQSSVDVYPETSGKIVRMAKALGDRVAQGETIAWIDPSRPGQSFAENPVLSPVAGTITSLPVTSPGATVSASSAIATVGSLGRLKITVFVAEKYSAYLRVGLPAFVSFQAAPGEELSARVSSLSPVVDMQNRTIQTTLALTQTDSRVKAGMFASVRLVIQEAADTMVVPRAAIKDYNGENVVYVAADDGGTLVAKRVSVKLGLANDSSAQVTEGLASGDRVIVAGSVSDGSPIRVAGAAQ